jgi:hypothetical protein
MVMFETSRFRIGSARTLETEAKGGLAWGMAPRLAQRAVGDVVTIRAAATESSTARSTWLGVVAVGKCSKRAFQGELKLGTPLLELRGLRRRVLRSRARAWLRVLLRARTPRPLVREGY